jgi:CubicO group peptidase (beta-lactamase class C family)
MVRKIFRFFVLLILFINMYIIISGRWYLYNAIRYNTADISDWQHFENRPISSSDYIPIPSAHCYNQESLNKPCIDRLKKYKSVAILAIKNDSVIHEQYWDGYDARSVSGSFSMAKSILSILVGIAVDEGKIKSIDEPVWHYIPSFKTEKKSKITIRHLLNMSSGLYWDESYINPVSLTTEAYYGNDLEVVFNKLEPTRNPGEVFDYASGNQIVLQQILKKVTGTSVSDYMSEKLWKPLHTSMPASWSLDHANGNEKAFCCVNSNARDFSKIGLLFLHKGYIYNQQIISKKYIQESLTPAAIKDEDGELKCDFYGLSWWLGQIEHQGKMHKVYYMRGILGQYVMVCPDYQLVVCRLGHKRDDEYIPNSKNHRIDIFAYTKGILEAYMK